MIDDHGDKIEEGDILKSKDNYLVLVCRKKNGFYGRLICEIGHSCEDIPYHLNNGHGHIIIYRPQ